MSESPNVQLVVLALSLFGVTTCVLVVWCTVLKRKVEKVQAAAPLIRVESSIALRLLFSFGATFGALMLLSPWIREGRTKRSEQVLGQRLKQAGLDGKVRPDQYRALQVAFVTIGFVVALALLMLIPTTGTPIAWTSKVAWLCLIPGVSLLAIWSWTEDRRKSREAMVLREMPFVLDLMTLGIESGMSLSSALVLVVDKATSGPFRDQLRLMLMKLKAGKAQEVAMRELADELDLPPVRSWVAAIVIANQQGASMAEVFRAQAAQVRIDRFHRAEKAALQAPVKMLLPLTVFIFPSAFVILFFPVISRLIQGGLI